MDDEELPPNPGLERGRSAIGVQNNAGLVIERVALELKREPSIAQSKPALLNELSVGSIALAHAVCGDDLLPVQVLSMIRARSAELAQNLEPVASEEASFEQANPANIPIAPGNVPDVPEPYYGLRRINHRPPDVAVFGPSGTTTTTTSSSTTTTCSSSCCSSSSSSSSSTECYICGGVEGETVEVTPMPQPEEKQAPAAVVPTPGQVFTKSKSPPVVSAVVAAAPSKQLEILKMSCSHSICQICFERQLSTGWTGARASFNYLNCGLCGARFGGSQFVIQALSSHLQLQTKVNALALAKFNEEGAVLLKEMIEKNKLKENHTPQERQEVALATMAIYKCVDCRNVFCGGRVSCAEEMDQDPTNMRCQACVWSRLARETDHRCMIHGFKFAIFKCDSCCAVATWDCGWNHFCERCHGEACSTKNYPCPGPDKCPLGMPHPANLPANFGQSNDNNFIIPFVIGCMACVGYTAENPGCSRPSPAEMHWEVKADAKTEEETKKKLAAEQELNKKQQKILREQQEQARKQQAQLRKQEEEQRQQQQQRQQRAQSAALPGDRQGQEMVEVLGLRCCEPKCKCAAFKPQKWQQNRCHSCYHWANSHHH